MSDVIVADLEFQTLYNQARSYGAEVDLAIEGYRKEVANACSLAAPEGHFATNMGLFLEMTAILEQRTGKAMTTISLTALGFLTAIDEADSFLY